MRPKGKIRRCAICGGPIYARGSEDKYCSGCQCSIDLGIMRAVGEKPKSVQNDGLTMQEINKLQKDCRKTYGAIQTLLRTMTAKQIREKYQKENF